MSLPLPQLSRIIKGQACLQVWQSDSSLSKELHGLSYKCQCLSSKLLKSDKQYLPNLLKTILQHWTCNFIKQSPESKFLGSAKVSKLFFAWNEVNTLGYIYQLLIGTFQVERNFLPDKRDYKTLLRIEPNNALNTGFFATRNPAFRRS